MVGRISAHWPANRNWPPARCAQGLRFPTLSNITCFCAQAALGSSALKIVLGRYTGLMQRAPLADLEAWAMACARTETWVKPMALAKKVFTPLVPVRETVTVTCLLTVS